MEEIIRVLKRYPRFSYGFGIKRQAKWYIQMLDYFLEWSIFCLVVPYVIIVETYHSVRGDTDEEME